MEQVQILSQSIQKMSDLNEENEDLKNKLRSQDQKASGKIQEALAEKQKFCDKLTSELKEAKLTNGRLRM